MDIPAKLQLIITFTGQTQEQLARRLGVTFATLNSWINGRSTPHKGSCRRIGSYFQELFEDIPEDLNTLSAKKAIIHNRALDKNVLELIVSRKDLLDQLVLSLTYNTNSIEGSTLTEAETAAVLFEDAALSNRTLTEQMEARNHRAALIWLLDWLSPDNDVRKEVVLKLHAMLMNGIRSDAGAYRDHAVRIVGANVPTTNPVRIPERMSALVKQMNRKTQDVLAHAARIHAEFEQIHPFSDGNGRVGRLLIQAMLLRANIPPAVILKKKKSFYLKHLNAAQTKEDHAGLEDFLCDAVFEGYGLITDFNK